MKIKPGKKYRLLFLLIGTIISVTGFGQLSPGELSRVHKQLEGLSNCTKCHILGKKVSNQKCLDCHTELSNRIKSQKGYHVSAEVRGKECIICHSDHHGLDFQIVRFDEKSFNHTSTGFELSGAHIKSKCRDCHKAEFIGDTAING